MDQENNQNYPLSAEGLVLWYPFDGDARDKSGQGNDAVISGAILSTDRFGNANRAFSFDGIDDYLEANDNQDLDIVDQITLCAWIKQKSANKDGSRIIDKTVRGSTGGYLMDTHDGSSGTRLRFANTTTHSTRSLHTLEEWHFLSVSWDSQTVNFYLDGKNDGSYIKTAKMLTNDLTLRIGAPHAEGAGAFATIFFNGLIDDVRIYNRALSQDEIKALYHEGGYYAPLEKPVLSAAGSSDTAIRVQWKRVAEAESYSLEQSAARTGPFSQIYSGADSSFSHEGLNKNQTVWYRLKASNSHTASAWSDTISATASAVPTQGLVAWYPLNGTPNDQSGNGLNGVVHGALVTADRFNQNGKAYYFNGATFIEVADNGLLDITRNLTLCAWYRCDGKSTDWGRVVSKSWNSFNDPWISYGFVHDTNGSGNQVLSLMVGLSNSTSTSSGGSKTTFAIGKWHFLCGIFDSDMKKIAFYVDGIKEAEAALTVTALAVTNGNFAIGRDVVSGQGIVGSVDDVRIYNRILSPIEILALYHEGGFGL